MEYKWEVFSYRVKLRLLNLIFLKNILGVCHSESI